MKYLDEYRDPQKAGQLLEAIAQASASLKRPARLMEVCGTHTVAIFRAGLHSVLPDRIELVSGPGCPVCVTAATEIDRAIKLAKIPGVIVVSFGDMIRVPGSVSSLGLARAEGAWIEVVYSTFEALELARQHPDREVAFLGVGFETTAPTIAAAVIKAKEEGLRNFSVLSLHKLLPPALKALLDSAESDLSGFLMPGHVSAIIGAKAYQPLASAHRLPCVVCGFETLDILQGVLMLIREIAAGRHQVLIQYGRAVNWEGNAKARAVMDQVFEPAPAAWRGLGVIPESGLAFKSEYAAFDASARFDLSVPQATEPPGCGCDQVLRGLLKPTGCPLFRQVCTPENPIGPCMVSTEGTCAAYFRYQPE